MKVLAITNLFPNNLEPAKGVFNKQQFCSLSRLCSLQVVAPVPWVPPVLMKTEKSFYRGVKNSEEIDGIRVYHPRYFAIPKIGRFLHGICFYWGIRNLVHKIKQDFDFDVIFATWAYPDCYAASLLAEKMNKPAVMRVHGTDINEMAKYPLRPKMIAKAFRQAKAVIANSGGLKKKVEDLGVAKDKVKLVINGVDKAVFKPMDKAVCRKKCSLSEKVKHVLFIGNLVEVKGINYLIEAMRGLDGVHLHIIGEGHLSGVLRKQSQNLGLADQVHFWGRKPHYELADWLNACDVFCLPSLNEGCPNVILEALACGTAVVASDVGAIPDLIAGRANGILVEPGNAEAIAKALKNILKDASEKFYAENMDSWDDNARKVFDVLKEALR